VPSVASEANTVLPPRPYQPTPRGPANDAGQSPSPFAELLDSAAAASDRPRPPQSADRIEGSQSTPAKDSAPVQDSTANKDAPDSKTAGAPAADGGASAKTAKNDAAKSTDRSADTKAEADADEAAALAAVLADAAPALSAPVPTGANAIQPTAVAVVLPGPPVSFAPTDAAPPQDTVEAGAIAALQAAAQPAGMTKPAPAEAKSAKPTAAQGAAHSNMTEADVSDASQAKAPPSDPQAAVPQAGSSKGNATHANPDDAPDEIHHIAADAAVKLGNVAPPQGQADTAAAAKASTDAVQSLGAVTQANHANAAAAAVAPAAANASAQTQAALVPVAGLAVEIATQAHAGKNHFEIRLDPPELGRIDVRLHVDRDGNVSSRLVVDRADTLDLLKRDAQSLERALQQAGLKTSDNALEFSLRQQQTFARDDTPMQTAAQLVVPDDDPAPLEALRQGYGRLLGLGGGLDIRV
jgi:flagellar hook-length control protein FliK